MSTFKMDIPKLSMDEKELKRKEYFKNYYLRKKELLNIHQKKRGRPKKTPMKLFKERIITVLNFT